MKLDEIQCKARLFWIKNQDICSKLLIHHLKECKDLSVVQPWISTVWPLWNPCTRFSVSCPRTVNWSWDWLVDRKTIEKIRGWETWTMAQRDYIPVISQMENKNQYLNAFCNVYSKLLSPTKGDRHPLNGHVNGYCTCCSCVNCSVKTGTALWFQ